MPAGKVRARGRQTIADPVPDPLIAPEADSVAAGMVAQPRVMEEGNRRFQLCFRVFDPEVKGIIVLEGFQAPFGRFGRGIFERHRAVDGEYYDLPWRFSVEGPVWKVVREDLATAVAILGRGHQFLGGASVSQSDVIPGHGFRCIGFCPPNSESVYSCCSRKEVQITCDVVERLTNPPPRVGKKS